MNLDTLFLILNTLTALVTVASAIVAITPTKKDDAIFNKIKPFLDILALNVGQVPKGK